MTHKNHKASAVGARSTTGLRDKQELRITALWEERFSNDPFYPAKGNQIIPWTHRND